MKNLLAFLLLCAALSPAARAQEDDGAEASGDEAQPAAPAAEPAGERHRMTEAEKLDWYCKKHPEEGANCRPHARLLLPYISDYAQYDDVDTRGRKIDANANRCGFSPKPPDCPGASSGGNGSNGGAIGPLTGVGGAGLGKDIVLPYANWETAPHHLHYARILANYNATGPGTVISLGFRALDGSGIWSWVEDVNGSYLCQFRGWISATPNGPPLPDTVANKPCAPLETGSTGAYRGWTADHKTDPFACVLKAGGMYWFNLKLLKWSPNEANNNSLSCIEHITPQGPFSRSYFNK